MRMHDLLNVHGEDRYPKCCCCGMQVNPTATGHHATKTCKVMHAARLQRKAVSDSAVALDAKFYAYREELERVEVFKYLGRLITFDDDDTQAVRGNLAKARRVWARISRILQAENASARVCGMFEQATVQSVHLFVSETWVLSPATLQRLEGFHVKAARRMTGLLPKKVGGSWKFPKTKTD